MYSTEELLQTDACTRVALSKLSKQEHSDFGRTQPMKASRRLEAVRRRRCDTSSST